MIRITVFILFISFLVLPLFAEEVVSRIDIEGNNIVSDATIISKVKIRAGQEYNENIINTDVKNLYGTGFFETVEAEKISGAEGMVIVFKVKEKSVLKEITINGANFIRANKLLQELDIKEGSFVDDYKMKENVRKIKDIYNQKGFSQASVDYELIALGDKNEVEAVINISEKRVLKVIKVIVSGNHSMKTGRIFKVMKTRKAWLFNRGLFKDDVLRDDVKRIKDFYKLEGFSDVDVKTDIDYADKGIIVTVKVDEGKRYYVGKIKIEGNEYIDIEDITKVIALKEGSIFSDQAVYADSSKIREVYVDKGYIFSQVEPYSFINPVTERVDVAFNITENEIAYVEDIQITGNTKTKDKVIRRELRIYPGDKFDGKKVRRSKEKLENLGFFDEIRLSTDPGSETNYVDLVVDVKEAKTGYVSFGGGYSSIEEFIGFVELRQRNFDYKNFQTFTGAGQDLSLTVSMGTLTDRY
ncbi:MAG: outer membrane protein assembly factor BamA, partial [Candidatus Omnitrophica bacterium]|nr:outer membrane protein assembly factor BamA [Candidatus Omnitrophota bacterium]